jgi:fructokinase
MDVVTSANDSREHPGGSPMNVSFGLARLSQGVTFLTRMGQDARGEAILAHLTSAGVEVVPGLLPHDKTSSATAVLDSAGAARYVFDVEWSLPTNPALPAFQHLHFGSISAFLEPGATSVELLARQSHDVATISYDPNIRPQFLSSRSHAVQSVERHIALSDVVKASDEDVAWLYPGEEIANVATRWLALGPAVVVVTLGAGGSLVLTPNGSIQVEGRKVVVADTIGAGDSFMSGLIAGLAESGLLGATNRKALRDAPIDAIRGLIETATLCAAITVSRAGAQPPTSAELAANLA